MGHLATSDEEEAATYSHYTPVCMGGVSCRVLINSGNTWRTDISLDMEATMGLKKGDSTCQGPGLSCTAGITCTHRTACRSTGWRWPSSSWGPNPNSLIGCTNSPPSSWGPGKPGSSEPSPPHSPTSGSGSLASRRRCGKARGLGWWTNHPAQLHQMSPSSPSRNGG